MWSASCKAHQFLVVLGMPRRVLVQTRQERHNYYETLIKINILISPHVKHGPPAESYTIYSESIISDANIGFPFARVFIFFETNVLAFVVDISCNMMCSKIWHVWTLFRGVCDMRKKKARAPCQKRMKGDLQVSLSGHEQSLWQSQKAHLKRKYQFTPMDDLKKTMDTWINRLIVGVPGTDEPTGAPKKSCTRRRGATNEEPCRIVTKSAHILFCPKGPPFVDAHVSHECAAESCWYDHRLKREIERIIRK